MNDTCEFNQLLQLVRMHAGAGDGYQAPMSDVFAGTEEETSRLFYGSFGSGPPSGTDAPAKSPNVTAAGLSKDSGQVVTFRVGTDDEEDGRRTVDLCALVAWPNSAKFNFVETTLTANRVLSNFQASADRYQFLADDSPVCFKENFEDCYEFPTPGGKKSIGRVSALPPLAAIDAAEIELESSKGWNGQLCNGTMHAVEEYAVNCSKAGTTVRVCMQPMHVRTFLVEVVS